MKYYSTNQQERNVSLEEAVVKGLAADKGLYMPDVIKSLPASFYDQIEDNTYLPRLGRQVLAALQCSDCYRLQKSALCTARDEFGCSFRECVALLLAISPRISWFMDNMSCFFTLPK